MSLARNVANMTHTNSSLGKITRLPPLFEGSRSSAFDLRLDAVNKDRIGRVINLRKIIVRNLRVKGSDLGLTRFGYHLDSFNYVIQMF